MNLDKIETNLALALSHSDGPIKILATFTDGSVLSASLTKDKIYELSEKEHISEIKIGTRLKNRRKNERPGYKDRRWDK